MTTNNKNNLNQQQVDPTQMDGIAEGATTTDILSALDSLAHLEHAKKSYAEDSIMGLIASMKKLSDEIKGGE